MGGIRTEALRRDEWDALVAAGLLDDQQVELLDGRKVVMPPEGPEHTTVMDLIADRLQGTAEESALIVRVGHPIALSDVDEPEPDVAVVAGPRERYRHEHPVPADTHLVVEVSRSSRRKDLSLKVARYAAAGIPEYWVVDLAAERTVVHRDPAKDGYRSITDVPFDQPVTALALPDTPVFIG